MKQKLFLTTLALVAATAANAQKVTGGIGIDSSQPPLLSVPSQFAYSDTPMLLLYDSEDSRKLNIYDENIDLKKTIQLKDLSYNYQLIYHVEEREVKDVVESWRGISREYGSYQDFLQIEKNKNPSFTEDCLKFETLDNGDRKITFDYTKLEGSYFGSIENQFFKYYEYGEKYPYSYLIEHEGKVTLYSIRYKEEMSDWVDKGNQTVDCSENLEPITLYNINLNNDINEGRKYFQVSQTLFNDDEKFEYIVPKVKLAAHGNLSLGGNTSIGPGSGYEETVRKTLVSEDHSLAMVGVQVVSESGNVIKDIDFEQFNGNLDAREAYVITIGKNIYLAFDGTDSEGKSSTIFFKIDRATTSIQRVENVEGVLKVSPTIVNKGNIINVDLGNSNNSDSEISVYSSNGAKIKTIPVQAGQRSAQFVLNVPAGMYLVNKTSNHTKAETSKIIIK